MAKVISKEFHILFPKNGNRSTFEIWIWNYDICLHSEFRHFVYLVKYVTHCGWHCYMQRGVEEIGGRKWQTWYPKWVEETKSSKGHIQSLRNFLYTSAPKSLIVNRHYQFHYWMSARPLRCTAEKSRSLHRIPGLFEICLCKVFQMVEKGGSHSVKLFGSSWRFLIKP